MLLLIIMQAVTANSSSLTQQYLNHWAIENRVIGAALSINNSFYFYGVSDKQPPKPVSQNTQFGIGSITKTFVSVILLKLEAEHKINIHDSITKYFPQYPKLKKVSIKSLMQMTAGFNDVADDSASPKQQIDLAYQKFNPNHHKTWTYSNVSYQLLGLLIEKVTHQSLNEELSAQILSPLHLKSIYIPNNDNHSFKSYQNGKATISNFQNAYAAGGLVSNVGDLTSFIRHLFSIKDLLPVKQFKELTTFVNTSEVYYKVTGITPPKFGLGVFKWNIPPYGEVLEYAGVMSEGFTSAYTVIGNNVIIVQSNTHEPNDFTMLWPHRAFTKGLMMFIRK